ncbi:MAG: MFS transporter, partial [Parvularculaceae bacterium]
MTQLDETQAPVKKGYRTYVLVLLTLVYAFNFVDRQIIGILSPFIKEDLGLDDAQLGFLKGLAFAIFYTIMGIPIAWLADRYNRVTIVSISLALWSLFTALSGKASNYTTLALARIGVGVGEAGGSPPSHSIISNLYAPEERSRALAIYALGIPIGIMLAYFASAGIIFGMVTGKISAAASPWRMVMLAVGLPGIVLAVLLRLTVREPVRP